MAELAPTALARSRRGANARRDAAARVVALVGDGGPCPHRGDGVVDGVWVEVTP